MVRSSNEIPIPAWLPGAVREARHHLGHDELKGFVEYLSSRFPEAEFTGRNVSGVESGRQKRADHQRIEALCAYASDFRNVLPGDVDDEPGDIARKDIAGAIERSSDGTPSLTSNQQLALEAVAKRVAETEGNLNQYDIQGMILLLRSAGFEVNYL